MVFSPNINVSIYTHIRVSTKNKFNTYTPVESWIVKDLLKYDKWQVPAQYVPINIMRYYLSKTIYLSY